MPILSHVEDADSAHVSSGHSSSAGHAAGHAAGHSSGHGRRLESGTAHQNRSERIDVALNDLLKILPTMGWLADTLDTQEKKSEALPPILAAGDHADRAPAFMAPSLPMVRAAWP